MLEVHYRLCIDGSAMFEFHYRSYTSWAKYQSAVSLYSCTYFMLSSAVYTLMHAHKQRSKRRPEGHGSNGEKARVGGCSIPISHT